MELTLWVDNYCGIFYFIFCGQSKVLVDFFISKTEETISSPESFTYLDLDMKMYMMVLVVNLSKMFWGGARLERIGMGKPI